jgi:hypothetical protein
MPAGLAVLAIAQMGVHLVFFLHIGTGPDNTNNVLALAFGLLVVTLIVSGTLWIMAHLNANMMPAFAIWRCSGSGAPAARADPTVTWPNVRLEIRTGDPGRFIRSTRRHESYPGAVFATSSRRIVRCPLRISPWRAAA